MTSTPAIALKGDMTFVVSEALHVFTSAYTNFSSMTAEAHAQCGRQLEVFQ